MLKSAIPLWVMAGTLLLILLVMMLTSCMCTGYFFVWVPILEEQRREEMRHPSRYRND